MSLDEVIANCDMMVKAGIMIRVKDYDEWKYQLTEIGESIQRKRAEPTLELTPIEKCALDLFMLEKSRHNLSNERIKNE